MLHLQVQRTNDPSCRPLTFPCMKGIRMRRRMMKQNLGNEMIEPPPPEESTRSRQDSLALVLPLDEDDPREE